MVVTPTLDGKLRSHQSLLPLLGLYCSQLRFRVMEGSPFRNVCTRDINLLPGVIGVPAVAVPAGWPLRGVEGAVRVGPTRFVEDELEGVGLTAPRMGDNRNETGVQRLGVCWRRLARRDGLLHLLWLLVVFARGFSHLRSERDRQTRRRCPQHFAILVRASGPDAGVV